MSARLEVSQCYSVRDLSGLTLKGATRGAAWDVSNERSIAGGCLIEAIAEDLPAARELTYERLLQTDVIVQMHTVRKISSTASHTPHHLLLHNVCYSTTSVI